MHQLALLRTTTYEGLPQPSDVAVTFSSPIAETDPIEEIQMQISTASASSILMSDSTVISTSRPLPCETQQKSLRHSLARRIPGKFTVVHEAHSDMPNHVLHSLPNAHVTLDGFTNYELQIATKKLLYCRRKSPLKTAKSSSVFRTLTLRNGPLPVPADGKVETPKTE